MDMNPNAPIPPYTPPPAPPLPYSAGDVWPPPPAAAQPQAVYAPPVCPFNWIYRRLPGKAGAKALISDMRAGYFQFDPQGIVIQAEVVPRAEIRTPVMIGSFLIGGGIILAAVANYVMENAFRHNERVGILWKDVHEVMLDPNKQQAGLIFDAPNYAGKIKTFCLVFTPVPGYYDTFAQGVSQFVPDKVSLGRTRNATPPAVWIILALLVAFLVGLAIYAAFQH